MIRAINDLTCDRRRFLQGVAASACALAIPNQSQASTRDPTTIEFWNPVTDVRGIQFFSQFINQFNNTIGKAQGIVVRNRPVPPDDNYAKYTVAMTSSGSPDVVLTYSYDLIPSWAANGFIQPLDAAFKQLRLVQSDVFPIVWDMMRINGHIWGLVQEFDLDQLFWNKAIHTGPPPRSIAEFDALAASLDYS